MIPHKKYYLALADAYEAELRIQPILDYYQIPKDQNVFYAGTKPDYQWLYNQMIKELQLRRVNFEDAMTLNLQHIFLTINRYLREKDKIGTEMLDTTILCTLAGFSKNIPECLRVIIKRKIMKHNTNDLISNYKLFIRSYLFISILPICRAFYTLSLAISTLDTPPIYL